jgi:hypothetical protein
MSDQVVIEKLKYKVVNFYSSKENLCYKFVEVRNGNLFPRQLVSHGNMMTLRCEDEVSYRGIHLYDSLPELKFETVHNNRYFGVNHYNGDYFNDYKILPDKKRFYSFNNSPKDILKPDTSLRVLFYDANYHATLSKSGDLYRLELKDTTRREQQTEGYHSKRLKVFYISSKDYSIVKYSSHNFWTSGDLENADSVVYNYTYYTASKKRVESYINNFKPLTGKKFTPPPPPKDSTTRFPEFKLPDSTGKIKTISSRYLLIDFWYKACGPCLANMKFLDKIQYRDVKVVLINVRDTLDNDVRKIISKHNFTFLFKGNELARRLGIEAYPTMYLIDERRTILKKHKGFGNTEELTTLLEELTRSK